MKPIPNVPKAIEALRISERRKFPVRANRASSIGHECERFLVYERTRWEEREAPPLRALFVFAEGKRQEKAVIEDMLAAGIPVILQQQAVDWPQYQLSGHIDGKILLDEETGEGIIFEVKSMSPFVWSGVETVEDLKKKPWTKRYLAQVQVYMLLQGEPQAILLLKNRSSGQLKQIEVSLDYEFAESILQKCERVNEHIRKGTLPDRVDPSLGLCGECPFRHICTPDIEGREVAILSDPELEAALDRRSEIEPLIKEWKELDSQVKAAVREKEKAVAGNWLITGRWVETRRNGKVSRYWKPKFERLPKANDQIGWSNDQEKKTKHPCQYCGKETENPFCSEECEKKWRESIDKDIPF